MGVLGVIPCRLSYCIMDYATAGGRPRKQVETKMPGRSGQGWGREVGDAIRVEYGVIRVIR